MSTAREVLNRSLYETKIQLEMFLKRTSPDSVRVSSINEWVSFEDAEAYIRVSKRYLKNEFIKTIEIANVTKESRSENVDYNPTVKSTGFMNRLMNKLETYATKHGIVVYVENVLNEFLPKWYERREYTRVQGSFPPSFYKFFTKEI